jgi:NAD(P)-dependent dehydrogenase (short-subunit alcohol dehydrogenase family)
MWDTAARYPEFAGQVAIITGSSRGIGKGTAIRLAREGMKVVINSRDAGAVEATAAELRALGVEVLAIPGDVGREEDVNRLFDGTLAAWGKVDLVVNNAADLRRVPFFEVSHAMFDGQLLSNIRGPWLCSWRAAQTMRTAGGGNIIHISSVGGLRAHWPGLPYDVTKGAIDAMTRAMALELSDYGIRVNAIAPGPILNERWLARMNSERAQETARRVPLARFGYPEEIGAAVAFLHSSEAAYITGQVIYIDGGLTAQLSPRGQPV